MAAALFAGGMLLYMFQFRALLGDLDRSLLQQARLFASTVELEFGELETDFFSLDMRDFEGGGGPRYLQLWGPDGHVAFRSGSLGETDLPLPNATGAKPEWGWSWLPDGRRVRSLGLAFAPSGSPLGPGGEPVPVGGKWTRLVVAGRTDDMERALAHFRSLLLIAGAIALLLSLAVLHWAVKRGLRPLGQVAAEIRELDEGDLSARVAEGNVPKEVQPVVERLNELLGRLEAAFSRERAFSAEVAHELRTPLSGIRTAAELAVARERTRDECREALQDILEVALGMEGMVEKLLEIARLESDHEPREPENVPLNDLLQECWEPFGGAAERKGLQVGWALGPESQVMADRDLLALALRNIVENAVIHADRGGSVQLATDTGGGRVEARVVNSGSLLSQEEAAQAFERFWRGDQARTEAGLRCGLGLSLVREVADALGADLSVRSKRGGEFCIALVLPVAPTAS
jgi:two-component system sensor histidine kinase QseC